MLDLLLVLNVQGQDPNEVLLPPAEVQLVARPGQRKLEGEDNVLRSQPEVGGLLGVKPFNMLASSVTSRVEPLVTEINKNNVNILR